MPLANMNLFKRTMSVSFNNIRMSSSKIPNSNEISWSTGEKQYPKVKFRDTALWYRKQKHSKYVGSKKYALPSSFLDPKHKNYQFPYERPDGGIQYFRFVYYPRHPGAEDVKITPSPLHFVMPTKSLNRCPYWEKDVMKKLGLDYKVMQQPVRNFVILKNTPEINSMLYIVKHLVEVKPLKLPANIPADANPLHYFINNDGVVSYQPSITNEQLQKEVFLDKQKMDSDWVDDKMRKIYHNSLDLEF